MDWLGDVSNFVVGATIHFIATVSAKILHHPDIQEALAQSVALCVQKLLKDGLPPSSELLHQSAADENNKYSNHSDLQEHQLLRILGKWLLARGGDSSSHKKDASRSTPKKQKKPTIESDSRTQCTAPTKVIHVTSRSATSTPFSTPSRGGGTTVSTREYETAPEDEYQEYLC
jgi:hypothetical protein